MTDRGRGMAICVLIVIFAMFLAFVLGRVSVSNQRVWAEGFAAGMATMATEVEEREPGFFANHPLPCNEYDAASGKWLKRCGR